MASVVEGVVANRLSFSLSLTHCLSLTHNLSLTLSISQDSSRSGTTSMASVVEGVGANRHPHHRLTRGTVTSTMLKAAHPSQCVGQHILLNSKPQQGSSRSGTTPSSMASVVAGAVAKNRLASPIVASGRDRDAPADYSSDEYM